MTLLRRKPPVLQDLPADLVEPNRLIGISDQTRYANRMTDKPVGPERPLKFCCGGNGKFTVDGWKATATVVSK